jgi:hypothetical protein
MRTAGSSNRTATPVTAADGSFEAAQLALSETHHRPLAGYRTKISFSFSPFDIS